MDKNILEGINKYFDTIHSMGYMQEEELDALLLALFLNELTKKGYLLGYADTTMNTINSYIKCLSKSFCTLEFLEPIESFGTETIDIIFGSPITAFSLRNHSSLKGRNDNNQHSIDAITGLREILNTITAELNNKASFTHHHSINDITRLSNRVETLEQEILQLKRRL